VQKQQVVQQGAPTISQFTPAIRETLTKINNALKSQGMSREVLFTSMDLNGNGTLEKLEMLQFFSRGSLPVK
jgi:hypothetical protein